ncbi:MAG TPA: Gfo/Idh/MocA family oxidoreductase [Roseimicrobium sp.]|nr:Gfo/Idh/MocA family oxidoreductase [Roseimicrobium sp.]
MNRRTFITSSLATGVVIATARAQAQRKLRVAVIGHTGRGDYGHGLDTMWLKLPETEIVGVADANPKGLESAQKKLPGVRGFADYKQMLEETKPDIVAVAPRHVDQHRDMAMATIASGARGIYMEKPFCRTPAEADEIIAACEKRNVKLAVAHRNRYHPALAAIDAMIKDGKLGRVLEMRARGKEDQRGGSLDLWVLGSHLFNLIHYFGGKPVSCSAAVLQNGKPVTKADIQDGAEGVGPLAGNEVHARFETERGIPAFFDSVQKAGVPAAGFGVQIIGTLGIVDLRIDVDPIAHFLPGNPFQPVKEPRAWIPVSTAGPGVPEPIASLKGDVGGHLTAGRDLIAAIRENRAPLCSASDARVTVEMISAVFESHRQNGARITLPLQSRDNPLARL